MKINQVTYCDKCKKQLCWTLQKERYNIRLNRLGTERIAYHLCKECLEGFIK